MQSSETSDGWVDQTVGYSVVEDEPDGETDWKVLEQIDQRGGTHVVD